MLQMSRSPLWRLNFIEMCDIYLVYMYHIFFIHWICWWTLRSITKALGRPLPSLLSPSWSLLPQPAWASRTRGSPASGSHLGSLGWAWDPLCLASPLGMAYGIPPGLVGSFPISPPLFLPPSPSTPSEPSLTQPLAHRVISLFSWCPQRPPLSPLSPWDPSHPFFKEPGSFTKAFDFKQLLFSALKISRGKDRQRAHLPVDLRESQNRAKYKTITHSLFCHIYMFSYFSPY